MSKFDIHGGYFAPQGYMSVDAGGSHEENPNGGVQVGTDSYGIPNLLEEGEPVYNDFVYSDNIYADGGLLKKNNLPEKYSGKLYSDIANIFVDQAAPGDYISNNGMRKMLLRLAKAQEEQKSIKAQEDLENELSQLSPEELSQLENMLHSDGQVINPEIQQEPVAPEVITPDNIVPERQSVFREGGPVDWYTIGTDIMNQISPNIQIHGDFESVLPKSVKASKPDRNVYIPKLPDIKVGDSWRAGMLVPKTKQQEYSTGISKPINDSDKESASRAMTEFPTWMRYAGVGLDAAMLLHNMFQEPTTYTVPEYSPELPTGSIRTVNQRYRPIDPNLASEAIMAQGNATRRAINNSGAGPSTMAGIVASDYNLTRALGNAINQGWYNANSERNNVIAANNATEAQRANFDFNVSAQQANAINEAGKLRAHYAMLKQQLDNAEDSAQAQAISSQMNAIAKALADMGNENFVMNQINQNQALYWGYDKDRNIVYQYPRGFIEEI